MPYYFKFSVLEMSFIVIGKCVAAIIVAVDGVAVAAIIVAVTAIIVAVAAIIVAVGVSVVFCMNHCQSSRKRWKCFIGKGDFAASVENDFDSVPNAADNLINLDSNELGKL